MNRHSFFLLGLLLCVPALWADPVDKEQAMQKAQQFYNSRGQTSKVRKLKQAPRTAEMSTAMENDCFYVFNAGEDGGYVIISGDDRTPDVLGYADSGTFSAADMPENMKAWLDGYAAQISSLASQKSKVKGQKAKIAIHPAIPPQMETKWNQNAPFNNQCPVFFDESKYGHAITGCVALAMAQVMKSWNYPNKTLKAIPGYTCQTDWSSQIGSDSESFITVPGMDVTTFDWENMLNIYDDSATDTQKKAVATLLQACATAIQAEFGTNDYGGGTSANAKNLKTVLTTYFDYDKGMRYVDRNSYTADEWDEIIYSEVSAHRPMFFSGRTFSNSGHSFVVDGYDGQGYYHVNWGWGGLNNGYFLLSNLTPEDEWGLGSGTGGYNLSVSALIGVKPNAGHDNPVSDKLTVDDGFLKPGPYTRSSSSDDFTDITVANSFYNYSGSTASFDLGYGIYDSSNTLKEVVTLKNNVELQPNRGFSTDYATAKFSFGAGITSGEYYILPISKLTKSTQWLPCDNAWSMVVLMTINENTLTLSSASSKIDADMDLLNTPEVMGLADIKITLTNNGPYFNGQLYLSDSTYYEKRYYGSQIELQRGETKTLNVSIMLEEQKNYVMRLYLSGSNLVRVAIPIKPTAPKAQKLDCTYEVTNANASRVIEGNQMEMTIEYENKGSNNYDNEIRLDIMKRKGTTNSYSTIAVKTDRLTLEKGAKTKHSYVFRDLEDGGAYMVAPMYKSNGKYYPMTNSEFYTIHFVNTPPEVDEAYAVVNEGTLTFYYDSKKDSREGKTYAMNEGDDFPGWAADSTSITKAVIDTTFVAYSPTSTAHWFEYQVNLTSIEGMENLNTSETTFMRSMFYGCYALPAIDVTHFDTKNVTDMSWMFYYCKSLKGLDVSKFNTSKVTNMKAMFYKCELLTNIEVSSFDTSNVTDMSWMFYSCSSVKGLGLSKFNTSKVTNMKAMFYRCDLITSIDVTSFDTSNVTDMSFFLYGCQSMQYVDMKKFNTSKVKDMEAMFFNCSFRGLDLSSFDTQNVTNMAWMFYNCGNLGGINFGTKFNTSKVTNMKGMFQGCASLKSLDLSSFDTRSVTDMSWMFYCCLSLPTLNLSSFNTSNVTNMENMFVGCIALTKLDLGSFNTAKVTTMEKMFSDCQALEQLNVSSLATLSVTNMTDMFKNCKKLKQLDLSRFSTDNVEQMECMFQYCGELETIYASHSWNTSKATYAVGMFDGCFKLVGGAGTKYVNYIMRLGMGLACIDGENGKLGYFTQKAPEQRGDVNGDVTIDVADIANVIDIMSQGGSNGNADVNEDGTVDVADISTVIDRMAGNPSRVSNLPNFAEE